MTADGRSDDGDRPGGKRIKNKGVPFNHGEATAADSCVSSLTYLCRSLGQEEQQDFSLCVPPPGATMKHKPSYSAELL